MFTASSLAQIVLSLSWPAPCEVPLQNLFSSENSLSHTQKWQWPQLSHNPPLLCPQLQHSSSASEFAYGQEGQWVHAECQLHSGYWCHACAHRGRAEEVVRGWWKAFSLLFPAPLFRYEWIFQKRQPFVWHNRQRLSRFYASLPTKGSLFLLSLSILLFLSASFGFSKRMHGCVNSDRLS